VTPSLAATGDINLSDATDSTSSLLKRTTAMAGSGGSGAGRASWVAHSVAMPASDG